MSPVAAKRWRLAVSGLLVWVIAATVGGGYYLASISHSNRVDREQAREIQRDHNSFVCITRKYIETSHARSAYLAKHDTTAAKRAVAAQAAASSQDFLDHLITIPVRFDCSTIT